MQRIGIIGAMQEEVALLKEKLVHREEIVLKGATFYKGYIHDKEIILLQSGIGKVNAAIGTTILCQKFEPEMIINTGTAGGVGSELSVGDIIISDQLTYGDVDATAFGYEFGQVPQMPAFYRGSEKLARLAQSIYNTALEEIGNKAYYGLIVTTDSFISNSEQKQAIQRQFPAVQAVEMEATAIAQTASHFEIPFVIIRAISDTADGKAADSFDTFVELASKQSASCILRLLEELA